MNLDPNKIYHQYITRMVIFSLFTFKRQIRQPNVYKMSVRAFIKKRIPWDIKLEIDLGERPGVKEERDILLEELLNDVKSTLLSEVKVKFITPLKKVNMVIDLRSEKKYEDFIYK